MLQHGDDIDLSWLSPDEFGETCGFRTPYVPRGVEDQLWQALREDIRRVAVLMGEPRAGTSRLAFELARGAEWARYPDPRQPVDPSRAVAQLAQMLATVSHATRPVVVIDGPRRAEGFALLAHLVHEPLHPRLLVLVPACAEQARRLPDLAGRYPLANFLVATVERSPAAMPGESIDEPISPPAEPDEIQRLCEQGEVERAVALIEQKLAHGAGDDGHRRLLDRLARLTDDAGAFARAADAFRAAGDVVGLAGALAGWTTLLYREQRFDDAERLCAEWMQLEQQRGSFAGRLAARTLATEIAAERRDLARALALGEQVLADRRALGDYRGQVLTLHRIATLARTREDFSGAVAALEQALELERIVGNARGEAFCHFPLGELRDRLGQAAAAAEHYQAALEVWEAERLPGVDRVRAAAAAAQATACGVTGVRAMPPPEAPAAPTPLVSISIDRSKR